MASRTLRFSISSAPLAAPLALGVACGGGEVNQADLAFEFGWPSDRAADRAGRLLRKLCAKRLVRVKPNCGKVYELTRAGELAAEMFLELDK